MSCMVSIAILETALHCDVFPKMYIGYGCLVTCVALIVMKTYLHVDGSCNDVGTASKMS